MVRTPRWARKIFRRAWWQLPTTEKVIYLTFDDGPQEAVTDKVLDLLYQYQAKATFFCIGKNAEENPELLHRVIADGHAIGNHTQQHLNGWKTQWQEYLQDVRQGEATLRNLAPHALGERPLFRPPYGKLTFAQYNALKRRNQVVMWDVLTCDYDPKVTPETVLANAMRHIQSGSIVVFHDSVKASKNMLYALPQVLKHFSEKGYRFKALPPETTAGHSRL